MVMVGGFLYLILFYIFTDYSNTNGHEADFYKAKRRIDDMNLHKKTRRIQLE